MAEGVCRAEMNRRGFDDIAIDSAGNSDWHIGNAPDAQDRMPGSIAVALHGIAQGMQILRVHDTLETRQAISLHMAVN